MTREPIAYVAAPLSAPTRYGIELNRARAARWVAWVARKGVTPSATWIVLTGVLEETPENRRRGLEMDCRLVEVCDVVLHVAGRISDGMRTEGEHARSCGIPVIDLTGLGEEPPQFAYPLLEKIRRALAETVCVVCLGNPAARPIDGCPSCLQPSSGEGPSAPGIPGVPR